MVNDMKSLNNASELRRLAEEKVTEQLSPAETFTGELDAKQLLHELQVHQVELEMQNEDLLQTQADLLAEKTLMNELLDFLALTSSRLTDEPFFNRLASYLAKSLDMDFVCIDRLEGDGLTATTVAVWCDGHFEDNVSYALKDTPCGDVVGKHVCCFPASVSQMFPRDQVLQDLRAESYVGVTLWSHTEEPIGLIAVISRRPLANRQLVESIMNLVAIRAAGEMERLATEETLWNEKAFLRALIDSAADLIYFKDHNGTYLGCNKASEAFVGLSEQEQKGKSDFDLFAKEMAEQIVKNDQQVLESSVAIRSEEWVLSAKGSRVLLDTVKTPIYGQDGKPIGLVGISRDITQLKLTEAALQKRLVALTQPMEAGSILFDELFDIAQVQRLQDEFARATGVASLILYPDGTPLTAPSNFTRLCSEIIRTNEKGCANCRISDTAIGRFNPDGPIIQPCLSGGLWDAGAAIVVNGQHIASWLIGQVRDETQTEENMAVYAREIGVNEAAFLEAFREVPSMTREKFEQIAIVLFTLANQLSTTAYQNIQQARFINERNQALEALQEREERLRSFIENINDILFVLTPSGEFSYVSPQWEDASGYYISETIGKPFMPFVHPDDVNDCLALLNQVIETGERQSGFEFRVQRRDGTLILFMANVSLIKDARSGTLSLLGIARDITERRQAAEEKRIMESQLHQSQKMESVGRLAGGVAHDFNNMLSVILGHAELGLMNLEPDHPVCEDLKEIRTSAERSADLTRQLLAFARKQTVTPKVIDLNEAITSMLNMLQRLIGEDIKLYWHAARDLWLIKMDSSQVDQILANLCVNARDAITDIGRITIETANSTLGKEYCADHPGFIPGEYVLLSVSDDGHGMDKETLEHIFEPFYTTKEQGKGTGLGLATVYGVVKQNKGFISIDSEPGKGATFSIYLPRHEGQKVLKPAGAMEPVQRGKETILVVEDEPAILKMTSLMLEKQGYTVLTAGTPGLAIELAQEHHGEIHLLMTDVIMPEMNGRDLAKNLLSMFPNMKRLFMSGYTADVIAHHGVLDEGVHFIQKPFSMTDLAAIVRETLDGR